MEDAQRHGSALSSDAAKWPTALDDYVEDMHRWFGKSSPGKEKSAIITDVK